MPRDAQDFLPSWEVGGDSYAESGAPMGQTTEDEVRAWLMERFDEAEVDRIMSNATKSHEGGEKQDPTQNKKQDPTQKKPKGLFPGDRQGKGGGGDDDDPENRALQNAYDELEEEYQNEGNPFAKRESNPGNPPPRQ
ncbi:MAG: hypothetical protein KGL39_12380 [Patescibacteria group bacterium]|nr:hypothetical protein [Patescibacteria group bacterium]